ncbi:LolA-like protein [Aeromicrobium massiliense]|uniref:LppX_LprAFG lipoprotein n=1 Tax=Aeromicrobium massiliense TaxID=1464554 RepID=UPI000578212A|nr:LppX_LprAFG lipoprotein [Aeromicrobium massiliense]
MKARRPSMLAATALAAALVLGACGSDGGSDASSDTSAAASKDAEPATLTKDDFAERIADAQVEAGTSHMTMTVDAAGQKITGEGDVRVSDDPAKTAVSMTMDTGETGAMDLVLVDQVMYMRLGQLTSGKYVKIDLTDESNPIGKQYGSLVDQLDPSAQVEQLDEAISGFEATGDPVQIDGVEAQPYEVTVDTAKLQEAAGQSAGQGAAGMPATIEYTMWIGPDDLIRRMTTTSAGTVTVDYSKWGEDLDIAAPKASEITDQDPFSTAS